MIDLTAETTQTNMTDQFATPQSNGDASTKHSV